MNQLKNQRALAFSALLLTTIFISDVYSQSKKPAPKKTPPKKEYIMFCGNKIEKGTNLEKYLPSDWENTIGFYCLKNYREGIDYASIKGANNNGIIIAARGERTGELHTIIWTCSGQLF